MRVEISPATVSVAIGTTQQLTATAVYSDGTTQNVTSTANWTPENAAVASVGNAAVNKGLLRGIRAGSTSVSATFQGASVTAAVTVTPATPVSLSVTPTNPFIPDGGVRQLAATMFFSDGTQQDVTNSATWTTARPAVATVNSTGLVTAIDPGSSVISATAMSLTQSATVTVTSALATSLTVTPFNPAVPVGGTQQFTATVTFSDSTTRDVTTTATWISSLPGRATISDAAGSKGLATARLAGATQISAEVMGVRGAVTMTVTNTGIVSIDVTPKNANVAVGFARPYQATARLSNGTTRDVTTEVSWTSSNTARATIGNAAADKGIATGVAAGPTTITAKLGNVEGSTALNVTAVTLTAIGVTPANPSIALGLDQLFTAIATFSDASTLNVTDRVIWASSNVTVASISNADGSRGLASSLATGTTTVSASIGTTTGQTVLTVADAALTAIEITPTNLTVAKGLTQSFTATGRFTDEVARDITTSVTWSSSSPAVATISNDAGAMTQGRATAVQVGTTTITATRSGINGTATMTVTDALLVSIDVTPKNANVGVGFERAFQATARLSDATTRDITTEVSWTSGDPALATIGNAAADKGIATGVAEGQTTITATLGDAQGSTTLNVNVVTITAIGVTPANPSIALGLEQPFTAIATFSDSSTLNVTDRVTWASSDEAVATISNADGSHGLASSIATGTTTVSASIGPTTGQTVLTVADAALTAIEITPVNPIVAKGLTQAFTATGTFTDEVARDITTSVTWSSSSPAVATISNDAGAMTQGRATGIQAGTTTITATRNGVTASTTLRVTAAVLQTIDVTPADASVPVGAEQAFTATGTYSDGSTANLSGLVTWASSQTSVATISNVTGSRGLATARATGTTTISATSISGAVVGSTSFIVTPIVLRSIQVTPAAATVVFGGTRQLTATGTYSDGSTRNITTEVTWATVDPSIASVSNATGSKGLATAAATTGAATITATDPDTMIDGAMTLTVVSALLTEIRVTPAAATLPIGFARQYTALGVYSNGSEQDVTTQVLWTSTAPAIAPVSNASGFKGVVSGTAVGGSTIRATLSNGAGTNIVGQTGVTVTAATLTSIAVTPGSVFRPSGSTQQFVAVGTFSDGSTLPITEQVTWASSEASVATISNQAGTQGLATVIAGLLPITTTISATRGAVAATATLSRGLL
ncbi:hypothetical protein B1810_14235 [Panacagrimonas perspica]|uniref:beta strand repeat-containing protein n=1 Tax=Panacagrimonas perspica TaxID=381431 RepID=UPI00109FAA3B|nr:Ig-like domain-containing protein [Panacagrimonas perspica]THD02544.1 hypothetical protein B1810_14235 [Panacagrimonas perspica]